MCVAAFWILFYFVRFDIFRIVSYAYGILSSITTVAITPRLCRITWDPSPRIVSVRYVYVQIHRRVVARADEAGRAVASLPYNVEQQWKARKRGAA